MRKLYCLFYLLVVALCANSQQLTSTATIEPITADSTGRFASLQQLNKYWAGAQVIALGEQTHYDGATFDAKVQLIKHLHEKLGFNVLAFESGYYECTKANELLATKGTDVLKEALFSVWDTKSLADLEAYILQTQKTARPLVVTGFDFQFSGKLAATYFLPDLEAALKQLGVESLMAHIKWPPFKEAVQRQIKYSNYFKKPSPADTLLVGEITRMIIRSLDSVSLQTNNQKLAALWKAACRQLLYGTQHRYQDRNYRDSLMAASLLQQLTTQFTGEKIICWNATSHFIYNPRLIDEEVWQTFVPMGHHLYKQLGSKLYTIGFTSLQGKAGALFKHKLKSPPANSIEYKLGAQDHAYAFIDFSSHADHAAPVNSLVATRMLGNKFMQMNLPNVVSGLFYIKEAYPPRY